MVIVPRNRRVWSTLPWGNSIYQRNITRKERIAFPEGRGITNIPDYMKAQNCLRKCPSCWNPPYESSECMVTHQCSISIPIVYIPEHVSKQKLQRQRIRQSCQSFDEMYETKKWKSYILNIAK